MRAVVAGYPAFQTNYTLRERSMQHSGREFFTVAGGLVNAGEFGQAAGYL